MSLMTQTGNDSQVSKTCSQQQKKMDNINIKIITRNCQTNCIHPFMIPNFPEMDCYNGEE